MFKSFFQAKLIIVFIVLFIVGCGNDSKSGAGDGGGDSDEGDTETDTGEPIIHRIIAIGDNHADLEQAILALRIGGVIDEDQNWIGGTTYVVQTGDIIDRGVQEKEVIDMYEALRPEAQAAGGNIINMNGNHEIMTAYADYRYMIYAACVPFQDLEGLDLENSAFDELPDYCKHRAAAFWPGGPYAQIIAEWPMIYVLQDSVFVHGGLHQKHLDYGIDEINEMTRSWLLGEGSLVYEMVGGGEDSVDWDRTYSDDEEPPTEQDCTNLEAVLYQLGVVRMVVGHSVQSTITTSCNDMAWLIDVGMAAYYGGVVEVLEITPEGETNILYDLID